MSPIRLLINTELYEMKRITSGGEKPTRPHVSPSGTRQWPKSLPIFGIKLGWLRLQANLGTWSRIVDTNQLQ